MLKGRLSFTLFYSTVFGKTPKYKTLIFFFAILQFHGYPLETALSLQRNAVLTYREVNYELVDTKNTAPRGHCTGLRLRLRYKLKATKEHELTDFARGFWECWEYR